MAELPCPHCGYDLGATPQDCGVRVCSECGRSVHRSEFLPGMSNAAWYGLHACALVAGAVVMASGLVLRLLDAGNFAWMWLVLAGWLTIAAVVFLAQALLARSRGERLAKGRAAAHSLARALVMVPLAAVMAFVLIVTLAMANFRIH